MVSEMDKKPFILDIKGNSLDDGPGIRTVVFFKGCPLGCVWCHNPESKQARQEISFDPKTCVKCGTCVDVCPEGAIGEANPYYVDRNKCTLCFQCADQCPSGAMSRVGTKMDVDEIVKECRKDKPFFDTSGGGVTLSGGEATMFMDFTSSLVQTLKNNGIHILVETCGQFDLERFEKIILPYINMVYFDIKLFDEKEHRKFCNVGNKLILNNFIRLNRLSKESDFNILPRTPLIPEITDRPENIAAIAGFLKDHDVRRAQLLAYNPLWNEKNFKIGETSEFFQDEIMGKFPAKERVERCRKIFRQAGVETI